MPRGGSRSSASSGSSSSGRSYVNNASNRSLGREGMPVGSMVVSRSSGSSSASFGSSHLGGYSSSARSYVDNASNRSLGRVGMPVGSMVVSSSASSGSSRLGDSSSSGRTYVDNASNRNLGRVGMSVGSMVVSKSHGSASGSSTRGSSTVSEKTYVDNSYNRSLGRVGMPKGSMVVSKTSELDTYVDNQMNRRLGRVGKPVGTMVFNKKSKSIGPKYYEDNAMNRKLGRNGKVVGTMPVSKCSKATQMTKDAFQEWKTKEKSEVDLSYWFCDLEEMDQDYMMETLLSLSGRAEEVLEWQQEQNTTKLPTTSDQLLKDFSGPVIDYPELVFKNKIGSGAYGEVFFAYWKSAVVAVKKLKLQRVSKKRLDEFQKEVSIFCKLDHPNIVQFLGACVVAPDFAIVMEYMQCSLFDALHFGSLDTDLSEQSKKNIILQAAMGLEYLHELDMAHCDVKSTNVLLDASEPDEIEVKLTDFGLSMIKNETESSMSASDFVKNAGTPRYSAPEVLRGELLDAKAMKRTDMYSFGLVVYEILYEGEPFPNLNYNQLRTQVGEKGMIPEIPECPVVNPDLMKHVQDCWNREPVERPMASEIVSFIKGQENIYEIRMAFTAMCI